MGIGPEDPRRRRHPRSPLAWRPRMIRSRWLVYPIALVFGVAAGLVAHSGIVAGSAALVFALVWIGVRESR